MPVEDDVLRYSSADGTVWYTERFDIVDLKRAKALPDAQAS
jgi:hypothetical protein